MGCIIIIEFLAYSSTASSLVLALFALNFPNYVYTCKCSYEQFTQELSNHKRIYNTHDVIGSVLEI